MPRNNRNAADAVIDDDDFYCPIGQELMQVPAELDCGHIFELEQLN